MTGGSLPGDIATGLGKLTPTVWKRLWEGIANVERVDAETTTAEEYSVVATDEGELSHLVHLAPGSYRSTATAPDARMGTAEFQVELQTRGLVVPEVHLSIE